MGSPPCEVHSPKTEVDTVQKKHRVSSYRWKASQSRWVSRSDAKKVALPTFIVRFFQAEEGDMKNDIKPRKGKVED